MECALPKQNGYIKNGKKRMSLQPLANKLLVSPIPDADQSEGGIWIPDQAKERTDQGIVIYRGPDVKTVRRGDMVLFSGFAGQVVNVELEGEYILLPEDAVDAILRGDTENWVFSSRQLREVFEKFKDDIEDEDGRQMMGEAAELVMSMLRAKFFEGLF